MTSSQAAPNAVPGNLFQCGICPQSFTRIDHLGRHVRSRSILSLEKLRPTNEHRDLLSRHASLHSTQRERPPRKRRHAAPSRASQACEACAVNHLRCDDDKPCRRCQKRKIICNLPAKLREVVPSPLLDAPSNETSLQPQTVPEEYVAGNPDPLVELRPTALPDSDTLLSYTPPVPRGDRVAFSWETNLDLSAIDLSFLESYNVRAPFDYDAATVSTVTQMVQNAEDEAPQRDNSTTESETSNRIQWRFVPAPQDTGYAEHANLLLSPVQTATPQSFRDLKILPDPDDSMDLASRDKILNIFLSQMPQPSSLNAASFPSPELLDRLLRYHLTATFSDADMFIHRHTFSVKASRPELHLALAAAGAVLTPDSTLQKLGFAMQEVLRHQLPAVFEAKNTLINDLQLQQAFLLSLEIGLWSGNGRKMELCESSRNALITMLRRRGRFDRAGYPPITVHSTDTGQELDDRWRRWIYEESAKRLVYRVWQLDIQCSIALMGPPLVSYAELSLPLPASSALWDAPNAERWRDILCLQEANTQSTYLTLTLTKCIMDVDLLERHRDILDIKLSCAAVIQALWGLNWEYRQMSRLSSSGYNSVGSVLLASQAWPGSAELLMASRYQQLTAMLESFSLAYRNVRTSSLYLNVTLMHLHLPMSLEEIQLFATKLDQHAAADRIEPSPEIKAWSASKEGRVAVYHAAQTICESRACPPRGIRGFIAVSLYQATLVLWAYAYAVREAIATQLNTNTANSSYFNVPIWLDTNVLDNEHENGDIQRFISFGRGRPMLRGELLISAPTNNGIASLNLDLWDPSAAPSMAVRLLKDSHWKTYNISSNGCQPPLVERLVHALQKLLEVTGTASSLSRKGGHY
ncbi:hypothetical protein BDV06DRAFT_232811 [Aspergillus oleicola]